MGFKVYFAFKYFLKIADVTEISPEWSESFEWDNPRYRKLNP